MAKDFVTPEQYQRGVGKIKNYVDNLSVIAPLDSTSNDEYIKVNLEDLELTKTYIVPKGRYIGILVTKKDGTKQSVLVVSNTCFSIYVVSGNKGTANRIFYYTTNFGSYKVNVTSNIDNNGKYIIKQEAFVLGADNLIEYNPQTPYSPATKKYVDDTVVFKKLSSIVELNSDKKIINVEKFEDNKVYYFINDINEGNTTLIPILLYKGGEKNSIIMLYPNDRFVTMSYNVSANEFFSFSDMQSVKYNLVDKTREYNNSRSVTKKVSAEQVLTKTNTTAFTPTSDYHPTTKKYVDDKVVGLATESYVDSKTSMENVIYEGNGTGADVISDYWTGCPVSSGNGCWVINKQITFDSSKPNPYYLLCDNTLYSPENSTFDAANSAWIYPKVHNTGTIFICNKYNGENKLVLPWDNANSPSKMKLYTKTELATAISDGDLEATSDEVKAMLANVLGGDYSGEKN